MLLTAIAARVDAGGAAGAGLAFRVDVDPTMGTGVAVWASAGLAVARAAEARGAEGAVGPPAATADGALRTASIDAVVAALTIRRFIDSPRSGWVRPQQQEAVLTQ